MAKRAGATEKISISLNKTDLASLKKRAKRLYGGNVSAVIGELAADAARLEAMRELVEFLGGPLLTDRDREGLDQEWGQPAPTKKRPPNGKRAA